MSGLASDALNRAFGSSTSASSAYQKSAQWALILSRSGLQMQGGLLTNLKFENRLRESFGPKASNHRF
ncbi:hypothetical protein JTE90_006009 [Oedothorax gibbosus]|uniref:Uncharacterized protein n=1 Tax=Oedothorax gibbosus TaxID=931172 RepID=A0AAV6TGW3_9ARAC|nr:hypothetical protein JTE90_006009 [Oedothorax gibbosus]